MLRLYDRDKVKYVRGKAGVAARKAYDCAGRIRTMAHNGTQTKKNRMVKNALSRCVNNNSSNNKSKWENAMETQSPRIYSWDYSRDYSWEYSRDYSWDYSRD